MTEPRTLIVIPCLNEEGTLGMVLDTIPREIPGIDEVEIPHGREYRFHLRARSFLHNQVRSIVGTLERVGAGSWSPDRVADALAARDRAACGPVCPPHGLYLCGVGYPKDPFAA